MARKTKLQELKSRLKEIKNNIDKLEQEQHELNCDKCDEIDYQMYNLEDEAEDINEEINQLKKKKK